MKRLAAVGLGLTLTVALQPAHAQPVRTERDTSCDSLQARAFRHTDSVLAIPRSRWRPEFTTLEERNAIQLAHVVFQVRVDTTGRPDPRTFRVRRSTDSVFERLAQRELSQLDFPPQEPVPGCRVAFIATVPLRFSR